MRLTAKERAAVDALIKAVKELPPSICLEVVDDDWETEMSGLAINKRRNECEAVRIEFVEKTSICFG